MFTYRLKTLVILFFIGLLIGFFSSVLFVGCNTNGPEPAITTLTPSEQRKQAAITQAHYQQLIATLQQQNRQLTQSLSNTKALLAKAKQQTSQRQERIKQLLATDTNTNGEIGFSAKALLQKVRGKSTMDTSGAAATVSPCDSLKEEVSSYIQENALKDSLYEAQQHTQDSIIAVKDSTIAIQQQQISAQQLLFDASIQQQEILLKENRGLHKQNKQQRRRGKLLAVGSAILAAVAVNFIFSK